ncbi:hypothetical protein ANN_03133 [Periplaneta americana]|uniref:Fringe-like glycosyltransferase domain-containing protein n=1 Tax=Periplaneta americana TaxID=6978 RepID=A0ABQ8TYA8_PERAM|nr:hypothetical protein ANN_03133 [Periplaneta americana]
MVAYGEEHLCHPTTELVTFTPSRRRLPAFRRPLGVPTTMLSAARRRRGFHATLGVLIGLAAGFLVTSRLGIGLVTALWDGSANGTCSGTGGSWPLPANPADRKAGLRDRDEDDPLRIIGMTVSGETVHNSRKTLLFVGVMTAHKYLATRARAVYETWGREIPGRIAFFTSATSVPPSNRPDLPLVRLKGVDDSYPPQKKSFLMLQYMWERYGDRFEWFLRADDDVYVRPDRLQEARMLDNAIQLYWKLVVERLHNIVWWRVPAGNHVNYNYFLEHHLRPDVRRKHPNLLNSHHIVLHDGARSRIAASVVNLLRRWNWEILEHLPYSPDMSPCEFDLFVEMKLPLRGGRFKTTQAIIAAVEQSVRRLVQEMLWHPSSP